MGSDHHEVVACYLQLYEDGEVKDISSLPPIHLIGSSGKLLKGQGVGLIVGLY